MIEQTLISFLCCVGSGILGGIIGSLTVLGTLSLIKKIKGI